MTHDNESTIHSIAIEQFLFVRREGAHFVIGWASGLNCGQHVKVPLLEYFKLLSFLQEAVLAPDYPKIDRLERCNNSEAGDASYDIGLECQSIEGLARFGNHFRIIWTSIQNERFDLHVRGSQAIRLIDLLQNCLPIKRAPAVSEIIDFGALISINEMPRIWRPAYLADRYLRNVSDDELHCRAKDLLANTMRLDHDRKYRPLFVVDSSGFYIADRGIDWLRLMTDVHMEREIRGKMNISESKQNQDSHIGKRFEDESWCWRPDLVELTAQSVTQYASPTALIKYGKQKWNRAIFEHGAIRLMPASSYADPSLNAATKDNELEVHLFDEYGCARKFVVNDYYVVCMAAVYDYRLFRDFDADSCLVIHDVDEFRKRVLGAVQGQIGLSIRKVIATPVYYVDPHNAILPEDPEELYFTKHFRYAYQKEYRLVIVPRVTSILFSPIKLNVGSLRDIAELVSVD